jgi:hypothetical protein
MIPLAIIEKILDIVKIALEGQPPDVRAELWRMYLEDVKAWRAFWANLTPDGKKEKA